MRKLKAPAGVNVEFECEGKELSASIPLDNPSKMSAEVVKLIRRKPKQTQISNGRMICQGIVLTVAVSSGVDEFRQKLNRRFTLLRRIIRLRKKKELEARAKANKLKGTERTKTFWEEVADQQVNVHIHL